MKPVKSGMGWVISVSKCPVFSVWGLGEFCFNLGSDRVVGKKGERVLEGRGCSRLPSLGMVRMGI